MQTPWGHLKRFTWFAARIAATWLFALPGTAADTPDEIRIPYGGHNFTLTLDANFKGTLVGGDFNGDGIEDISLAGCPTAHHITLVAGGAFTPHSSIENRRTSLIRLPDTIDGAPTLWKTGAADFNGDGLDDLVFFDSQSGSLRFLWGRRVWPLEVDANAPDAHIEFPHQFPSVFARGDLNQDGVDDLIMGFGFASPNGKTYAGSVSILFGRREAMAGHLQLGTDITHAQLYGANAMDQFGSAVSVGAAGPGGHPALLVSARGASPLGRAGAGEVYIINGRPQWPLVWDLGETPAPITLSGKSNLNGTTARFAGDLTGDGLDELLIRMINHKGIYFIALETWVLDGSHLTGYHDLNNLPAVLWADQGGVTIADFDGDGVLDIFKTYNDVLGVLSSDAGTSEWNLSAIDSPTLRWISSVSKGPVFLDVTGDGLADIVTVSSVGGLSEVQITQGFRPLRDPAISLQPGMGPYPRVTLNLEVRGQPTEMRLSGDLDDPQKDLWIPYTPQRHTALTPEEGPKTARVRYRNAALRESAEAETSTLLTADTSRLVDVSNRAGAGADAVVDVHMPEAGPVRARVYDGAGRPVRELANGWWPAGIGALRWDGRSDSGRRAAPGVYHLVVEFDGKTERKHVLLR